MTRPATRNPREDRQAGFTLIELLIVVAMVGILAAIAIPSYKHAMIKSREAVLAENLHIMRSLIQQYYVDKGRYPLDLEELVSDQYMRKVPRDPFTGNEEWNTIQEQVTEFDDPAQQTGIVDVTSLAPGVGTNGVAYSEW